MAVISVSPARALRRPLRPDVRAVVGILLMLVAIGGSVTVWTTQQDTRGVLVAAHDLPAGTILQPSDLAIAQTRLDDTLYQAALPSNELSRTIGRQLAEPAHANQILARGQLSTHPLLGPDQEVLAIPIRADSAAGGRIRAGDSVQIVATDTKHDGTSHVVLPRVTVYEVGRDQSSGSGGAPLSGVGSSAASSWITLVVDQQQALQLTAARWADELDVAVLPPQAQQ